MLYSIDERLGERRMARLRQVDAQLVVERRQRERRAAQARLVDNARAARLSELVYEAYVRGHGMRPPERRV